MADSDPDKIESSRLTASSRISGQPLTHPYKIESSSDPNALAANEYIIVEFSSTPDPNASPSVSSPDTCASHRIPSPQRMFFIATLPEDIKANHIVEIRKLFVDYGSNTTDSIDCATFELGILKLIKDEPSALQSFKELLPTVHLGFRDRVRNMLYDETDNYMMWLKHYIEYQNGSESFQEFKRNVESYFTNREDLWKEFDANLAPSDHAKRPIPSGDDNVANTSSIVEKTIQDSSAGASLDSSDVESASKRTKTM